MHAFRSLANEKVSKTSAGLSVVQIYCYLVCFLHLYVRYYKKVTYVQSPFDTSYGRDLVRFESEAGSLER